MDEKLEALVRELHSRSIFEQTRTLVKAEFTFADGKVEIVEGEDAKNWWSSYWRISEKLVKRKWWQVLLFD